MTDKFLLIYALAGVNSFQFRLSSIAILNFPFPSIPEGAHHIQVSIRWMVNDVLILPVPLLFSSHVVTEFESGQDLQALQRGITQVEIVVHCLSCHFPPFGALTSCIWHTVAIIYDSSTELSHSLNHHLFYLLLFFVLVVQNVKSYFEHEQMSNRFVAAGVAFVCHVCLVVLNSVHLQDVQQNIGNRSISKVEIGVLVFAIVIKNICPANDGLGFVFIVPEGKTSW